MRVCSGKYPPLPPTVSEAARSAVASMLVVDPSGRVTIEALQQHPWFAQPSTAGGAAHVRRVRLQPSESLIRRSGSNCGAHPGQHSLSGSLKKLHSSVTVNLRDDLEGDFLSSVVQQLLMDDDAEAAGCCEGTRRQPKQLPHSHRSAGELGQERSRTKVSPPKARRPSMTGCTGGRNTARSSPDTIPTLPRAHNGHG
jgi:hypothetical protein